MEQLRASNLKPAFDEMNGYGEGVREPYAALASWLGVQRVEDLKKKSAEAEALFRRPGITFAVYGDEEAPNGSSPSTSSRASSRPPNGGGWQRASSSASARSTPSCTTSITARRSSSAGRIPAELILQNGAFVPEMMGLDPPRGIYSHIIGVDIVRVERERILCARGQSAHAVRRLLYAGGPGGDDAPVPGPVRAATRRAGRELSRQSAPDARKRGAAPAATASPTSRC